MARDFAHYGSRGAVTDLDAVHRYEVYVSIACDDVIADIDMCALTVGNDAAFLIGVDLVARYLASCG